MSQQLIPIEELKKDNLSRLEKMKMLPKQLKFILQTDKKRSQTVKRKVRHAIITLAKQIKKNTHYISKLQD